MAQRPERELPALMTTRGVALLLRIDASTLSRWRLTGRRRS